VLGGKDIETNKCDLCDRCHQIIHAVFTEQQALSHSELIKIGIQKKKEALERGEQYIPRSHRKSSNTIGRPKLQLEDIPEHFVTLYKSKEYKNISDLARKANMSRTTVYRYIDKLENN
jgi:hypothetical protein